MKSLLIYLAAAGLEIFGCYAFWMWLREAKSSIWAIPAVISLIGFALLLTRIDTAVAGRAFAAYGGIYIAASLLWMRQVEGQRPDSSDGIGAALCIAGALIILLGPRG